MDATKLNQLQAETLTQFRAAVQDCKLPSSSDVFLLRWLIARDFDLIKAEKMLRASSLWRRQNRIDTLPEDFQPAEVLRQFFPAGLVGVDKLGNPLWVIRYGRIDFKGILQSARKKDYFNHCLSLIEACSRKCNISSSTMTQSTSILDLEHFSIRQLSYKPNMELSIKIVQCYEANYPENMHQLFVVNAPDFFAMIFAVVKPFLSEKTAQKIHVFKCNEAPLMKKAILEHVDASQLPLHYGGTMVDPDGNPHCITKVGMGGSVPKSYYFNNQAKLANSVDEKILTVSNKSRERLEFQVNDPGSALRWEFCCKEGDIDFAVYESKDNAKIPVVPKDRVECHITPEVGQISIDPGQYIVEFDNSFSYLRSKVIHYVISIDSPPKVN